MLKFHKLAWRDLNMIAFGTARIFWVFSGLLFGFGGCGTLTYELGGSSVVPPGLYNHYPCVNIGAEIRNVQARRTELEQLMSRSAQSVGGEFVNTIAYRSEYLKTSGQLDELAKASADKHCSVDNKYSSGRSVY